MNGFKTITATGAAITALLLLAPAGASAQEEEPKAQTVGETGYKKGFYIKAADGPFDMTIGGRLQVRYAYESTDDPNTKTTTVENAFSIPRARIKLKGHAYDKDLAYQFQFDFGKGFVSLKDGYVEYTLSKDWLLARAGQFKRPFSRQQITSSGNQELVDRAITDKAFHAGRDIGVMLHNNYKKSPTFEYAIGLFNGSGDKAHFEGEGMTSGVSDPTTGQEEVEVTGGKFSNVPDQANPTLVVRLGYNYGDLKGYTEADLEGGGLRAGVAVSILEEYDADGDDASTEMAEGDLLVKYEGFSLAAAGYHATVQNDKATTDKTFSHSGYHAQLGYVIAKTYQPVVRYAVVDPAFEANTTTEALVGLSVYGEKHNLKWQTDVGTITEQQGANADDVTTTQVRTQLQLTF